MVEAKAGTCLTDSWSSLENYGHPRYDLKAGIKRLARDVIGDVQSELRRPS